jgi:hypothetical protein
MSIGEEKAGPTEQEKTSAKIARKQWDTYNEVYKPHVKGLMTRTAATPGRVGEAQGMAVGGVQQAYDNGRGAYQTNHAAGIRGARSHLSRSGVGGALASSAVSAENNMHDNELQGRMNYVRYGHGLAGGALHTAGAGARNSVNEAISRARSDAASKQGFQEAIGMGTGAYYRNQQKGED